MEAPALPEPPVVPFAAPDWVKLLLQLLPAELHEAGLLQVRASQLDVLEKLDNVHLREVEQGWEADWQARYAHHTALLAEINRILAERFGI